MIPRSSLKYVGLAAALLGPVLSRSQENHRAPQATPAPAMQAATIAFQRGTREFQDGNSQAAKTSFETAVRFAPRVAAAHSALGAVLLSLAEYAPAEHQLEMALALHPGDTAALLQLAAAQAHLQENAACAKTLDQLRRLDPNFDRELGSDFAIPLASALSLAGDLPAAELLLQHANEATPGSGPLLDALGSLQAQQGRFQQAAATFQSALQFQPALAAAHYHLGVVQLELQHPAQAVEQLTSAHTLEPGNAVYTEQLAQALLLAGKDQEAVTLLQTTLAGLAAADPQRAQVEYRLALALQSVDRPGDALPLFAEVIKRRPQDPEALINAALAYVQTGDARTGTALYLRALPLDAKNPTLREDLGVAYLQQSDLNDALSQFRAGLALDPQSAQLHYDLALALKLKDDIAAAIPEFQRARELDPTLPDPPYTLGIIFMQQGKFAEAAENLERALALRPGNGDAWATLGSVYRELGQPAQAEAALRRAIDLLPAQPSPHITLAAVLAAEGRKDEAASERKIGADLTRVAVSRQKSSFALESGRALLKRGQTAEALAQLENAVAADPGYAAAHTALAEALEKTGRKAEAAAERSKAAELDHAAPARPTP